MVWFGLACLVFFLIFPVIGSQFFGPISIFLLATIGIGSMTALLTRAGDRRQLPILSGVILFGVLLSLFDCTDNHRIELEKTNRHLERATDVFAQWYKSRNDRNYYTDKQKPYPVFIVAAAGGGLYAAHHAATVLSRLQDRCPNFSQHVFAISGVSGGSLGGALFANLARRQAGNVDHADCLSGALPDGGGQFERQTNRFMDSDFLSPVLGAAMFPDALQRFFPALTSRFDRARAFESSLARAWTKLYADKKYNPWKYNPWPRPFLENWDTESAAPALILNSTNVEHGNRVAVMPFQIIDWGEVGNITALSKLKAFHTLTEVRAGDSSTALRDISLATAVSLSSRFPWVLPAGRLTSQSDEVRLVDGGYFENSGLETVFDLVEAMERFYEENNNLRGDLPPIKIHIIIITDLQLLEGNGSFYLGEILSPVRGMLSARESRAAVAMMRIARVINLCRKDSNCGKRLETHVFPLDLFDFDLPLGWLLASSTRKIIEFHSGVVDRAGTSLGGSFIDEKKKFARLGAYAAMNDEAACNVVAVLQNRNNGGCK
jgi:hypothetical protein